jgi:hypothetical protein
MHSSLVNDARAWPTPNATDFKGSTKEGQRRGQLSEAAETLWPTPTAGDAKASGSRNAENDAAHAGVSLSDMVRTGDSLGRRDRTTPKDGDESSPSGPTSRPQLNPNFVDFLMGLEPGWTCACVRGRTGFVSLGMES